MLAKNTPALSPTPSGNLTVSSSSARFRSFSAMSGASDGILYRVAAVCGVGSAIILLINAAKRSGLIATTNLTQILAPLAEILALGLIVGLFLSVGRRTGLFGLIAFVLNFAALASLEGVEVVINLVFSKLPMATIVELQAGPLGLAGC
ncbi:MULTISPECIES: hypothetical protein [unclassified Neorhizobium]|uniref:hypothetical protein n=1 Tax=unclassified Neorhizobium TaxID=2629175 RepID=UPI001FF500A1|nr:MULTISPECIES: hypothetical protein [unclassified Neorhizobium]MCJ9674563.1 hypothetical protein [Neorhizobium sp. SHOUNA12B]MCJ9743340.1 hypothetical protein [Neorhizobium sp. SHOUNA12A]